MLMVVLLVDFEKFDRDVFKWLVALLEEVGVDEGLLGGQALLRVLFQHMLE